MTATRGDNLLSARSDVVRHGTALIDQALSKADHRAAGEVAELADFISTALLRLAAVADRIERTVRRKEPS